MRFPVIIFLLPLMAACSGGSNAVPSLPRQPEAVLAGSTAPLTQAQSDARQAPPPQSHSSGATDLLYVANAGNNSITIYKYNATGDNAPEKVIAGPKTELHQPGALSEDAKGNLYVVNGNYSEDNAGNFFGGSVVVFAHGACGNVAPIRKLVGPLTHLGRVQALTVDQATGKIFVANLAAESSEGTSDIWRFPPNAMGNVAPFGNVEVDGDVLQLTSDSSGKYLIESSKFADDENFTIGIYVLGKQQQQEIHNIGYFANNGVADDPTTKTYVTSTPNGIYRFAENTDGNGSSSPPTFTPPVVSIITTATDCNSLALGYMRNIYGLCGKNAVYVYPHDASGKASPLQILRGSATKLNEPDGLYEGQ